MALDILATRGRGLSLLERYAGLLTERQRQALELYWGQDWSLSEIAGQQGISRAAVHDLIRRAGASLEDAEARLGLVAEDDLRRQRVARLSAEVAGLRRRLEALEEHLGTLAGR